MTMVQDKYLKDAHKLINESKETKGLIVKALLSGVSQLENPEELHLISNIFTNDHFEESKFITLAL